MTITEALAEIKTVLKRLESKKQFVENYFFRLDSLKDPFEKDGGSAKAVSEAMQSIADLEQRIVELRSSIQRANDTTSVTIEEVTKTISEWLVWRREVAPLQKKFLDNLALKLNTARSNAAGRSYQWGSEKTEKNVDLIVNLSETDLNKNREKINNILGQLDGQLSLKNATVLVA